MLFVWPDRHPRRNRQGQREPPHPFNANGRLAAILKRRAALGPDAFVFGSKLFTDCSLPADGSAAAMSDVQYVHDVTFD
jgi:hypothetical protein